MVGRTTSAERTTARCSDQWGKRQHEQQSRGAPAEENTVRGRPHFWAWMISIGVHLAVLLAFGVVKLSGLPAQAAMQTAPTARVQPRKKIAQTGLPIPKPKVKKASPAGFVRDPDALVPMGQVFAASGLFSKGTVSRSEHSESESLLSFRHREDLSASIASFGSFAPERRVCYLVDCSGSMRGLFGRVRRKLKGSIAELAPDQYFYIIFFGGDSVFELGGGRLVRATPGAKSAAQNFIDSIEPAGQTDVLSALEKALRIRDGQGNAPSVIYFLTDGFELTTESEQSFLQEAANLRRRFAPSTRVSTIGFWPQSRDRRMLEAMAGQSDGEFTVVEHET